ncbi:uncharacterized protein K452DRAFT_264008 [Aplosporella prunicola CBS 121167]|uniref:Uncharacterized protein n=1 Tax=Aplosporella prunicola CBS 121167 TaxID=1176127 RepID=A0A6A6BQA1_9PEZI|nr:uncharacterized protein K452DRAFT_264008 [Aplosporella prunicola CBS 121167]KAF2146289.1 hypothetical protein K452DRAFT_264008 [Aplosporella prunicola CBS 121167]
MAMLGMGIFYGGVITGIPVVTGVAEGVHHQKEQNKEAANETRMVKFYMDVYCGAKSSKKDEIDGGIVVLHKDRVWVCPQDEKTQQPASPAPGVPPPHPFTGFYIMYPDEDRNPRERGLVSTINTDPPMLNWIYARKETLHLSYGNRTQSIAHIVGPWDWTDDEAGVTLEGWEGFVAVEVPEEEQVDGLKWALYYDRWDDKLKKGEMVGGRRVLPCSLERRMLPEELRKAQEEAAEKKMQVKSSGDLKTRLDLKEEKKK